MAQRRRLSLSEEQRREIVSRLRGHPSDFTFRLEPRVAAAGALTGSIPAPLR